MIYEIHLASIRPLILLDLIQVLSVVQAVFVLTSNLRLNPRNLARHIIRRACEDRGERRSNIRREERCCRRGVVLHWDCGGGVLPWAQSALASWQVHRITQNHRMVGVGRDLCGSSSPTPKLQVVLLLASQPGPAKPFGAGRQSPLASLWPLQSPGFILQKRSTSFPTGNLQTQRQPKDRRRGCTCRALRG